MPNHPGALLCRVILAFACAAVAALAWGIGLRLPFVFLLLLGYAAWKELLRWRGSGTAHGTARLATLPDAARNGLLEDEGLILGRAALLTRPTKGQAVRALLSPSLRSATACRLFLAAFRPSRWQAKRLIRVKTYVHLMTIARTGGGKGVSALVPNLLTYLGSCVVTDPKGELFRLTADVRRRMGHRIVRLDPFGLCGPGSDTFNPMGWIDPGDPAFLDLCRDLANMLVLRLGTEPEPHWNDSAEMILACFLAYIIACEDDASLRHLQVLRSIVSSRTRYGKAIAEMQRDTEACHGVISRLGHLLTWFQDEELGSVMTTVQRHTEFLDSPAVAANTLESSFDPRTLRTSRVTVYLVLPHDFLATLAPLMRMWIGTILRAVTRGGADERNPVLFFIDEAAHLGKINALEQAVTLMRGMGVRIWFFFQSLNQLKDCYGDKAATILDNIGTQQYFAINSYETAEALSKRIGDATIFSEQLNVSTGHTRPDGPSERGPQPGSYSTSRNLTTSEIARRILKPEEILVLPEEVALVFHNNMSVIPSRLLRYYDAPEFSGGDAAVPDRGETLPRLGAGAVVLAAVLLGAAVGVLVAASLYVLQTDERLEQPFIAPVSPAPAAPGFPRYGRIPPVSVPPLTSGLYGAGPGAAHGRSWPGPPKSRRTQRPPRGGSGFLIRIR